MRLRKGIKDSFLAGLVLVAPLLITLVALQIAVNWIFGFLTPFVEGTQLARYTANDLLLAKVAAGGILLALVTVVGFVAQWSVGRRIFGSVGRVVDFLPVVRTVYSSIRQVTTSVTNRESRFEKVVLVEAPRKGLYRIALVTGESPEDAERLSGERVYNVFMPGSPNPTQGSLTMVPESEVHETDLSVRRGIHLLMTTGAAETEPVIDFDSPGDGTESPDTSDRSDES